MENIDSHAWRTM